MLKNKALFLKVFEAVVAIIVSGMSSDEADCDVSNGLESVFNSEFDDNKDELVDSFECNRVFVVPDGLLGSGGCSFRVGLATATVSTREGSEGELRFVLADSCF